MSTPPLPRKKAAFFGDSTQNIDRVFSNGRRQQIASLTECYPVVISSTNFSQHAQDLKELEVIFATWQIPLLTPDILDQLPNLRIVFYAAGSVRCFAESAIERGVTVCSAWQANAIPVAEFTLSQILLSNKGYFRNVNEHRAGKPGLQPFIGQGNFGATVALLGAGQIGRKLIEFLRPFQLRVIVFDPFLSEEAAKDLAVEKVSFEEAFRQGNIVSNHLANIPATQRMIRGCHLRSMPANATFINTGRGATIAEDEMAQVLQARPDLMGPRNNFSVNF